MYNLILKDLLLQKKSLIGVIIYCLAISVVFQQTDTGNVAYLMVGVACIYLFVMTACAYDEKNKSEVVLNSLPVSRREIVMGKYLVVLIYTAIILVFLWLFSQILSRLALPFKLIPLTLADATGIIISAGFLCAIYYPVIFKFGYTKSRYFNVFLFMAFFFMPSLLVNLVRKNGVPDLLTNILQTLSTQPDLVIAALLLSLTGGLVLLSYLLSIRIYRQREF